MREKILLRGREMLVGVRGGECEREGGTWVGCVRKRG